MDRVHSLSTKLAIPQPPTAQMEVRTLGQIAYEGYGGGSPYLKWGQICHQETEGNWERAAQAVATAATAQARLEIEELRKKLSNSRMLAAMGSILNPTDHGEMVYNVIEDIKEGKAVRLQGGAETCLGCANRDEQLAAKHKVVEEASGLLEKLELMLDNLRGRAREKSQWNDPQADVLIDELNAFLIKHQKQ